MSKGWWDGSKRELSATYGPGSLHTLPGQGCPAALTRQNGRRVSWLVAAIQASLSGTLASLARHLAPCIRRPCCDAALLWPPAPLAAAARQKSTGPSSFATYEIAAKCDP